MPACYTDRLSAYPGERVALHVSADKGPCTLTIARVGSTRREVFRKEGIAVSNHPAPPHADRDGCGWPAAFEFEISADWESGYYDIVLSDGAGNETHHFVVVKPAKPQAKTAFVLATNTYHSYNYWGGASAYADVTSLMAHTKTLPEAMADAIGVLSARRPFPQMLIAPPPDIPRLVNLRKRDFRERSFASDPTWPRRRELSPYDSAAGFLNKWEHVFASWAEGEGLALDYFTDFDLDSEPGILDGYDVVVLVGHSEYWSARERDQIEHFVDRGGRLAIFSGNTAFWKVRWENDGATYVCHKWRGFEADEKAKSNPCEGTHLWSHRNFARPEAAITGLSFIFGGYHRLGNCAGRGQAGYTIYN
ncbi:MAG TPA: N,N-dimethylformamidase beta subunit family domain-containing protein, partial [Rhizomicrobium sp.]|nr:N,N-dimethylformamidase beta subunit family domain-containing protein [Rhizomicrobium sp.]